MHVKTGAIGWKVLENKVKIKEVKRGKRKRDCQGGRGD